MEEPKEGIVLLSREGEHGEDVADECPFEVRVAALSSLAEVCRGRQFTGAWGGGGLLEIYELPDIGPLVDVRPDGLGIDGVVLGGAEPSESEWIGLYEEVTIAEIRALNRDDPQCSGLRLVCMDVIPEREADLNSWYNHEHLQEQLAIDGVHTARRFEARFGNPKYLALYDLKDPTVTETEAYSKRPATPRTRSMVPALRNSRRLTYSKVREVRGGGNPSHKNGER